MYSGFNRFTELLPQNYKRNIMYILDIQGKRIEYLFFQFFFYTVFKVKDKGASKMKKFGKGVVKLRIPILIISLLLLVPVVFGILGTRINYDILSYLPKDIETMKGQDILMDEFHTGAFSICVVEGMDNKGVRPAGTD